MHSECLSVRVWAMQNKQKSKRHQRFKVKERDHRKKSSLCCKLQIWREYTTWFTVTCAPPAPAFAAEKVRAFYSLRRVYAPTTRQSACAASNASSLRRRARSGSWAIRSPRSVSSPLPMLRQRHARAASRVVLVCQSTYKCWFALTLKG